MKDERTAPATGREVVTAEVGKKILWQLAQVADESVLDENRAVRLIQDQNGLEEFAEMLRGIYEGGMRGSYLQGPAFDFDAKTKTISWFGSWTQGRYVKVIFDRDETILCWDSGTGKESSYLGDAFSPLWEEEIALHQQYAANPKINGISI